MSKEDVEEDEEVHNQVHHAVHAMPVEEKPHEKSQKCKAHQTSQKCSKVKEITQKESTRRPSQFLCRAVSTAS